MAPPSMRPSSAHPSHSQTPQPNINHRAEAFRTSVLSILEDTAWPEAAVSDVQALIVTMGTLPDIGKFLNDEAQIPEEVKNSIELVINELQSVHGRLKGESDKYGAKKSVFRKGIKKLVFRQDPTGCSGVLTACRSDVEKSSVTLNSLLNNPVVMNEQHSPQVAEDQTRADPVLSSTQIPPAATTLASDVALSPATNPVQSNNNQQFGSRPTPEVIQASSSISGKEKQSSRRGEVLNGVNKACKIAEGLSGALPVVGTYVGAVAKVVLTVVEMVQAMDANDEAAQRIGTHVCRLSNILEKFGNHPRQPESSQTANGIDDLQQALRDVQHEIAEQQSQRGMKKFWGSSDQSGSLKILQDKVRAALEEIQLLTSLKTSMLVEELHNESVQNKHRHLLSCLGDGEYGLRGDTIEEATCLPGTRVGILERIDSWIRGGSDSERALWITGMAGRGKSTIASTVAHNWKGRACCAIYHFRRGQNSTNSSFVCALAKQLGQSLDPELNKAILSVVEKNEDIIRQRLDVQFNELLAVALRSLENKTTPILIIVDALDECDPLGRAVTFVELIKKHSASLPDNLKFLLTSRHEGPLLRAMEDLKGHRESLDSTEGVAADMKLFLSTELSEVKRRHKIEGEWPSPAELCELVDMAQGLFQWARTVVKYVDDGSPTDDLAELMKSPTTWSGVDELYNQILSKALERVKQHSAKRSLLLEVLGTLVAAPYPVSLEVVAFLHEDHQLVKGKSHETVPDFLQRSILTDLTSLLFIPPLSSQPIQLMHTSIRDLLLDPSRCEGRPYWVNLEENHQRLATACMRQMNRHLRENICNLKDLSKPSSEIQDIVEREVSKGVKYCCRSWSIHLTKGQLAPRLPLGVDFKNFSEEKVLFWLEVLSLVECFKEATMMAKEVHEWLSQHFGDASEPNSFVTLWNDVHRFTTAFSEPIVFSPIHIYVSALAHCPVKTELWKLYSRYAKVRTIRGVQPQTWSPDLWTSDIGSTVRSVAISPDGALLASGCNAGMIHLLDLETGRQIREPLRAHTLTVYSVCFSLDGKLLASGSGDNTIRLWDPQSGSQVGEPLTGHSDTVLSICFSPDGKLLASGSYDDTIRLWDPQTGRQVGGPLTGHSSAVRCVCFSSDGKLLASGSSDDTIRLWDPQTGSQVDEPLPSHGNAVRSVCFSPDGKLLASGCDHETIQLWDRQTGSPLGELSSSGKHLTHTSYDRSPLQPRSVDIYSSPLFSVGFSPDGKLLASGSSGGVWLWDPHTGSRERLTAHNNNVYSVCFSPDGKLLASGSEDGTIRLWDSQTGSQVDEMLTRYGHNPPFVCASPDGKAFACSCDQEIRLWDPCTGSQVGEPLTGDSSDVWSLCFSPDGKLLASGSTGCEIRLWNLQTGSQVGEPLAGGGLGVSALWFSPDSKAIAECDYSGRSMAWDVFTRQKCDIPPFIPHALRLQHHWVTFSSSRLFWLPSPYWVGPIHDRVALSEGKLAVTDEGTLSIFDLSDALGL